MKSFELILKNDKVKFYKTISWIIIGCNIICMILFAAAYNFQKYGPVSIAALALCSAWGVWYFKSPEEKPGFMWPFFILMTGWLMTRFWWVAIINLAFVILNTIAARKLIVQVNNEKIIYPSWPKKEISWEELNNVILKDGLLTIDLRNNKLLQQEISSSNKNYLVDEKEFNDFCKSRLTIN